MRIQNNVTAMNTHRMYTMNNDAVAASAKKLSSGYRINSAADDAAGLAISEKMRSQIRGLNMATKNSQDAISLVQTAEGALQETQNMLQRMNELAVQAATGTNEDLDRTALSKEFEQLKREINDVAEQTNFNNMKILDGSLSYKGYVRSAATAGVNATVETSSQVSDPAITTDMKEAVGFVAAGQAPTAEFADSAALAKGQNHKLQLKIGNDTYDFKLASGDSAIKTDDGTTKVSDLFVNATATVKVDGKDVTFKLTKSGSNLQLATTDMVDFDWNDVTLSTVSWDPAVKGAEETATPATLAVQSGTAGKVQNGVAATATTSVSTPSQTITIDQSKLKDGDSITIGDKTYTFYAGEPKRAANGSTIPGTAADIYGTTGIQLVGKDADGNEVESSKLADTTNNVNIVFDANNANSAAELLKNALGGGGIGLQNPNTASIRADSSVALAATVSGNQVTIKATITEGTLAVATGANNATETNLKVSNQLAEAANKALQVKTNSGGNKDAMSTTVEFDIAKMKDGDTFKISAGGQSFEVTFNQGDTRKGFMEKVAKAAENAGFGEVKGNALIVEDKKVDIELDAKWKDQKYAGETNALRIQVGALENEQLSIAIDSMNTASLGLDNSFLTLAGNSNDANIDEAGKAITATRAAINKVSDQRATLGAMQNRLDHKIANLKTTAENLTASESRIRDVDMAQEMTNFTKNNILSQAATAMLAQANSLPQNVLSLLG